ncbi:hypothetical protein ACIQUL_36475 [Streptomyces sp. NPDC090303]|uniref:hypothetical protein n=1 Tax=Streptomyces sp. NPDC090303 TaxID=3365960 RepID=UPI0038190703
MSWYVLVEANESYSSDERGELVAKIPVEGGREAALAHAEEMSRTYARGVDPEQYGRLVFRTSPTSWLVEQTWLVRYDRSDSPSTLSRPMRICIAELVFAREPADPPKKGWRRR